MGSGNAPEVYTVGKRIHEQDEGSENDSQTHRPIGRVQHRKDVVLDEAARVSGLAGQAPEVVLERGERADPTDELDCHSIERGRKVQPGDALPSPSEESAQHDKCDEPDVNDDYRVGKKLVQHSSANR